MADVDTNYQSEGTSAIDPALELPDYVTSPNAVLGDKGVEWRYGKPPDYSNTRKVGEETKSMNHAAGTLPQLVENLVKNWEIEASFKPRLSDWRTIDHQNYTFAMNGGPPQTAEHMLKVGTYNAIIAANEFYSPVHSDFATSHKTFKRMMPTFAWELIELYGGPPTVAFKWRHWGEMKNDYVAFNDKGEKVTAKAHGGPIEIFGVTVATVDDNLRLQSIDTWMDPLEMFRQIAPQGIVNKESVDHIAKSGQTDETLHEGSGSNGHNEFSHTFEKVDAPDSMDILTHHSTNHPKQGDDIDATASSICPFAVDSTVKDRLSPNQPELNLTKTWTPQARPTQGQIVETRPLVEEGMQPDGSSLNTGTEVFGTDIKAEQVLLENRLLRNTNGGEYQNDGTEASGVKRPKLTAETQVIHDQAPGWALASVETIPQPPQDALISRYSCGITGDVETDMNTVEVMSSVSWDASYGNRETFPRQEQAHLQSTENVTIPAAGEAVAIPRDSKETRQTYDEMSCLNPDECEPLMNKE